MLPSLPTWRRSFDHLSDPTFIVRLVLALVRSRYVDFHAVIAIIACRNGTVIDWKYPHLGLDRESARFS